MEVYQNYAPLNAMMKREMTETDYFHLIEDADVFSVVDFETVTKRTFRRVARGQRFIDIGGKFCDFIVEFSALNKHKDDLTIYFMDTLGFLACILLVSQAKHNDIYDKGKIKYMNPVRAVEITIGTNIVKLAQNLNVSSFIRWSSLYFSNLIASALEYFVILNILHSSHKFITLKVLYVQF